MQVQIDVRTLPFPPVFERALHKLVLRTLEFSGSETVGSLLTEAIFGNVITFGQLRIPSVSDWNAAIQTESLAAPSVRIRELVDLLKTISPSTPLCDGCGEFAINQIGGKFMELKPAERCPFCLKGHLYIEPMTLRTVNWATGELVSPDLAHDHHARVGVPIPITDAGIRAWVGRINTDLDAALFAAKVSMHGFLAYMHLHEHAFAVLEDASSFLLSPNTFDMRYDTVSIPRLIAEAERFLDDREVTNLPYKKFLSDGRRREEFVSVTIGDRTYLIDGKIGEGDKCDVYRARWDHEPTERVIIKALAVPGDKDLFDREIAMLSGMRRYDDIDSEFFLRFIPKVSVTGHGSFPNASPQPMVVLHDFHQFDWTLSDIQQKFPNGVHPRHVVWMMNRMTEFLSWLHAKRVTHGAVLPEHMLVNAWTHRIKFLDWGYATTVGKPLKGIVSARRAFYPNELLDGKAIQVHHDLAMASRTALFMLGSNPETGRGCPLQCPEGKDVQRLIQMLYDHAAYDNSRPSLTSASAFKESFRVIAESIYGPPRFVPFEVPGE